MSPIKYCLFVSVSVFLFTSCINYQYATLSGELISEDSREFIFENDTLKIDYWFTGHGGPINIKIYNKLKRPIYVDWSKSALIIDDDRYPYWNDYATINTSTTEFSSTIGARQGFSQTGGSIYKREKVSFIPPSSSISATPMALKNEFFKTENSKPSLKEKKSIAGIKAIQFQYPQSNSPLKFRSFLTVSDKEDFSSPIYIDNHFWISEITNTKAEQIWLIQKSKNQFYLSKVSGYGQGVIGASLLLILTGYIVFESAL